MADKSGKKENFFSRTGKSISKFFRETKSEAKKMVWPAPQSVFKNTGVVLATIIVIGLFVFGLDTLLINLLGLIMNVAG
ncbi:MAG: preprotein translocase subunit SecE [Oscillospiraceae bacterium]|jgi:preprotein translocase subunit SecE|nr:preprotein translocase subunit SecE [Oscillospiraceae bacterium]